MIRLRLALSAVSILALAACQTPNGEPAAPASAEASPVREYTQLMTDLRTLSADDMEGRDTGGLGKRVSAPIP